MYGMNIGYLNAIRSKNNIQSLSEIPIYKNPNVFNMTFKTKKWTEIHQVAIHCVHCIQQATFVNEFIVKTQAEFGTKQTKIYHSMHDLEEHFLNKHYLDYQYKCIYDGCYCVCLSFEQLIEHITIHYSSYKPFYCFCNDDKICCYKAAKQTDLMRHIESFHFIKVITDRSEQCEPSEPLPSEISQEKRIRVGNNNEYTKQNGAQLNRINISNGIGLKMLECKESANKQRKQQKDLTQKLMNESMNQYRMTQQLINEKIASDTHSNACHRNQSTQQKRYKLLQKLANIHSDHENMFGYKPKKHRKNTNGINIQKTRTVYTDIMQCKVNGMKIKQVNGSLKAIKVLNNKHNKENVESQNDRFKSISSRSSLATTPTINGSLSPRHHMQPNIFANIYKYPYPAFANKVSPKPKNTNMAEIVDVDREIPELIDIENDANAKQHANQKNNSKTQQHKNNNNRNRNRNGLPFSRPSGIPKLLPDTSQFKDVKPEFIKNIGLGPKYQAFSPSLIFVFSVFAAMLR